MSPDAAVPNPRPNNDGMGASFEGTESDLRAGAAVAPPSGGAASPSSSAQALQPLDGAAFRMALGQFPSGVTVVTTRLQDGRPQGLTVSAFCSVSLDPQLVLVCVDRRSSAHAGLRESGLFGVSVLAEGQESWSRRFATRGEDKFAGADLELTAGGCLIVPDALVQLECRIVAVHEAGDHSVYLGAPLKARIRPGRPLLYFAGAYRHLAD